jgi:hypothetical protein
MAPTNDKFKPPPWLIEALRMGLDVSPEAFEAALGEAGWKPNPSKNSRRSQVVALGKAAQPPLWPSMRPSS